MKRTALLLLSLFALAAPAFSQETLSLADCINYALEHNSNMQKGKLDREIAIQSRREILGALLPQVSGSGTIAHNFDKNIVVMPNFMNSMIPEAMRDPNADKYMVIPMGLSNTSNIGASLVQQVVNFSLFNALHISETAMEMADLGDEINTDDVISQTATFYYNIQVLQYGLDQFDRSISLMDSTMRIMTVNKDNGILRPVDLDRIKVARTNLLSQKSSLSQAVEVQKNLLKLTLGYEIGCDIFLPALDINDIESMIELCGAAPFEPQNLPVLRLMDSKIKMNELQIKAAKYELAPTLTFVGNYNYYFMSDDFYTGPTFNKYPMSMVSLSLKVPIFAGFSKDAKIKKAYMEYEKASRDRLQLDQSLRMAYSNAVVKLQSNMENLEAQKDNKNLAENVYSVTETNFKLGINSLSDLLNASSELIKAQVSYVESLNNCLQSCMELKKTNGTIRDINK